MKTIEEIAQWVINNRYHKSENDKVSDAEMYQTLIEAMNQVLRQPHVSGALQSVDPLDDENSEIHKIGREIAEMSDEEFEANCKAIEKMLKGSKGNDR